MRVILTAKENIKAKDGTEYVKCSFISTTDGKSGDVFTTKDKYESFDISTDSYVPLKDLIEFARSVPVVDVEFDQRGRVVSLYASER